MNWGRDGYSVVQGGEDRVIGGGVRVQVCCNEDGSHEVKMSGRRVAEFPRWCNSFWFEYGQYGKDCALHE